MARPSPRAAVVTPYFVDHDAVCNDVFHGAQALRRNGWEAAIFALGSTSRREAARPLAELGAFLRDPADLLYFHFSTGQRDVVEAVKATACRRVMKYHNITPPEFFAVWSDELAEASRLGRRDLPEVAGLPWERVLGASAFNLAELAPHVRAGTPMEVMPPFHETDALLAARATAGNGSGTPSLLTVGRIAPSKGHAFLLRVLRYLVHDLATPATLDIVGKADARMVSYVRMLALLVREYALEPYVRFHGEIATEALARRYAEASVFVMGSDHEGFCVPLVEAMAFGVPVVALGTSAIPETVGDAGIVWPERDPRRFAVTLKRLVGDAAERTWLGGLGRARYDARFSNARIEAGAAALFSPAKAT